MSGAWAASIVVLWAVVLFLAFLLAGALRMIGVLQLRLGDDPGALVTDAGLERGVQAPDFEAADVETGSMTRLSLLSEQPRLIAFMSTSCLACRELVPHLNEVASTREGEFEFLVVCRGDPGSCRSFKRELNLVLPVVADVTGNIEKTYEVPASPFIYVLDYQRRVLIRGVANDWRHLESLLEQEGTLEGTRFLGDEHVHGGDGQVRTAAAEGGRADG